jgi:aldose 1-epimerase
MADTVVASEAKRGFFGALADGTRVESVELTNRAAVSARIITLGATVQSLITPDRNGHPGDIVLGYATAQEYLDKPQYFGVTVGRYANRIAKGRFTLDGHTYTLATNDHGNHLHGGKRGFDKVVWTIDSVKSGPIATVSLSYVSPDGEEGYPGTLRVIATYSLDERGELRVDYQATTDKPTVVNITNHGYFNLSPQSVDGSVMSHLLQLNAARYTPVDATLIPTGERRPVAGTPFDFRKPMPIGKRIRNGRDQQIRYGRGYDHNFIVDGNPGELRTAARVEDPLSGRTMVLLTTSPGVQMYTGNFLDGTIIGKEERIYRQGDALCLEPQAFPDSPNHPDFPSARLNPGDTYRNTIVYRFSVAKP